MRERIIGAIAVVVVAIVFIPWLIAQVHTPRPSVAAPSVPVASSADLAAAAGNSLYNLPPLRPPVAATKRLPPPAPVSTASAPKAKLDTSLFDLPPLNPAKRAPSVAAATPATATPVHGAAASDWVVQVASFTDRKSAGALSIRLAQADVPAWISSHVTGGATWYRVMAGPYPDAAAAQAAAARIGTVSGAKAIVRQLGAAGG